MSRWTSRVRHGDGGMEHVGRGLARRFAVKLAATASERRVEWIGTWVILQQGDPVEVRGLGARSAISERETGLEPATSSGEGRDAPALWHGAHGPERNVSGHRVVARGVTEAALGAAG